MAHVIVRSWQETYRGLVPDDVLDDPGFLAARKLFWTAALTDQSSRQKRIAVAERGGRVIGVAMSGPPQDADAVWATQLYVLYVYADDHGTGAGAGLLDHVVPSTESAALWVADPNPRAQAFYRKHGFHPDGARAMEDGIRAIRMVRAQPKDPRSPYQLNVERQARDERQAPVRFGHGRVGAPVGRHQRPRRARKLDGEP